MDAVVAHRWLDEALSLRPSGCTAEGIAAGLAAISRLSGVLESQRQVGAVALTAQSANPLEDLAGGSGIDQREALNTFERGRLAAAVPVFGGALAEGRVGAGHLDRLRGVLRQLPVELHGGLLDRADELVRVAEHSSPESFGRHLRRVGDELAGDDGTARLERQRRAVRLRSWVGLDDGMHYWQLALDPYRAIGFTNRLRAGTEALFHAGTVVPDAPSDAREYQAFLRAHALLALLDNAAGGGAGAGVGRPEYIIVEDRRVPAGGAPVIDLGIPGGGSLPAALLDEIRAASRVRVVTTGTGADGIDYIVDAPGVLDHGRDARLATPAQRRALRALYATCGVTGCTVAFDECVIHHIIWWRNGGRTDLVNLIPLCWRHHADAHSGMPITPMPNRRGPPG